MNVIPATVKTSVIINKTRQEIWDCFTDISTWEQWHGVPVINADWRSGGNITFGGQYGENVQILDCIEAQSICLRSHFTDNVYSLQEEGLHTKLTHEIIPRNGALFKNDSIEKERIELQVTLDKFKSVVENKTYIREDQDEVVEKKNLNFPQFKGNDFCDVSNKPNTHIESKTNKKYCKNCGKEVSDVSAYCLSCGKPINIISDEILSDIAIEFLKTRFEKITDNQQTMHITKAVLYAKKVNLTGITNELVFLIPENTIKISTLPQNGLFYKLNGLIREVFLQEFIGGKLIKYIIIQHGFPDVCAVCGSMNEKYELYMFEYRNDRNLHKMAINGKDAQKTLDSIANTREYIALPLCGKHSKVSLYFNEKSFYTDDIKFAKTMKLYDFLITPIQQVAGMQIRPQQQETTRKLRKELFWNNIFFKILSILSVLIAIIIENYAITYLNIDMNNILSLVVYILGAGMPGYLFWEAGKKAANRIIELYKLPDKQQ